MDNNLYVYTKQEQTQFEQLLEAIGSGGGGSTSANNVSYNNSTSGLSATNVQEAIDEVNSNNITSFYELIPQQGISIQNMNSLAKCGNNVTLQLGVRKDLPFDNNYTLVSVLPHYKPKNDIITTCVITSASNGQYLGCGQVHITHNDGGIYIRTNIQSSNYNEAYMSLSWIV